MGETKGCKKKGRNSKKNAAYYAGGNYTANRTRQLIRHIGNNPNDKDAQVFVMKFAETRGGVALVRSVTERMKKALAEA